MQAPKVSIGIPTHNRCVLLERAVRSALAQDYPDVEVIVSDNASTDGTQALCERLAAADPRLRYIRQPQNLGPTRNFNAVLAAAAGEYFMWLSDDDWLDRNYVAECLRALADPRVVMAAGRCLHYDEKAQLRREDVPTNLRQVTPTARVAAYYVDVAYNSVFYGVMRTALLRPVGMAHALSADWLIVAAMALHGEVVTVETTRVHRTLGGTSQSIANIIRVWGLPAWQARVHGAVMVANCTRATWRGPWPANTPRGARVRAAALVCWVLSVRFSWFRRFVPRRIRNSYLRRFVGEGR